MPETDATVQASRWLDALSTVMARVTERADREGVITALAEGIVDDFGALASRIWLFDPINNAFHVSASAGVRPAATEGGPNPLARMPVDEMPSLFGRAFAQRTAVIFDDLRLAPTEMTVAGWAREAGLFAYAWFPLDVSGRWVGTMVVYQREPWPLPMIAALNVLARQAALALDHARLVGEMQTLQTVAADLASAGDAGALLDRIVEGAMAAFGADASAIWGYDAGEHLLTAHATRGLSNAFVHTVRSSDPDTSVTFNLVRRFRRPVAATDVPAQLRTHNAPAAAALISEGITSGLWLPMFDSTGEIDGMLALYHRRERRYGDTEIRLAQAFTNQIAASLHQTRLADQERVARATATRQLERVNTLARITERLLSSPRQEAVFGVVVEAAVELCAAKMAMIGLIDAERRHIIIVDSHGAPEEWRNGPGRVTPLDERFYSGTSSGQALATGRTFVANDYHQWPVSTITQEHAVELGARSVLAAPLKTGDTVIGVLWVADEHTDGFSEEDIGLIETLAAQASLAIERARLMRREQEAAILEERTRLGRDLHDSVTQSIFSVSMLARAARLQSARGSEALPATLERVEQLSQQALVEMRSLLFELQPRVLAEEGLAAALNKLVASYRVRFELPVSFESEPVSRLGADEETALFRIAQEALNNAVKHAGATAVQVDVRQLNDVVRVRVSDNGRGFAPSPSSENGGYGLRTMRERADAIGLSLRVSSALNAGTVIECAAPLPR